MELVPGRKDERFDTTLPVKLERGRGVARNVSATGISDLGPLVNLTVLLFVDASDNPSIQNIQPLLDNPGVGSGDTVDLSGTGVSCPSIAQLKQKGVAVISDCP